MTSTLVMVRRPRFYGNLRTPMMITSLHDKGCIQTAEECCCLERCLVAMERP